MTDEQRKKLDFIKEKIAFSESDIVYIMHVIYKSPREKAIALFKNMKRFHVAELTQKGRLDIDAKTVPRRIVREYLSDYDIEI